MVQLKLTPVLLGLGSIFLFCGCQDTNKKNDAKDAVAFYSYSAGPYSETVALRPNGQYVQTEIAFLKGQQAGVWRLLDKPGGSPMALPASASALPKDAVVELKRAMPFGLIWENQPPHGDVDRTIPASEFSIKKT